MARPINEEARAAQRDAILEAVGRLFAQHGFHQTGMAAICKAVGMSPGGLYRYFPSKAALIEGIVERQREETLEALGLVHAAPDVRQGLVELLVACATSDVEATALSLEVAAESARNRQLGDQVGEVYAAFTHGLAQALRAGQARGEIGPHVDCDAVALVLSATADGLAVTPIEPPDALSGVLTAMVEGLLGPRPER